MTKLIRRAIAAGVYFCAASFITLMVAIAVLVGKGALDSPKTIDILAAIYGLDLVDMRVRLDEARKGDGDVQIAYQRVLASRTQASLDLDLREAAIDNTLGQLHNLQSNVVVQRERHNQVVKSFEQRLKDYQDLNEERRLQKVQQMLENAKPKQAKDLLMMMMKEEEGLQDAVWIVSSLPGDKQKKIIYEFKTPDEQAALKELLWEIRQGTAENKLLDGTRDQLRDVGQGQQ